MSQLLNQHVVNTSKDLISLCGVLDHHYENVFGLFPESSTGENGLSTS